MRSLPKPNAYSPEAIRSATALAAAAIARRRQEQDAARQMAEEQPVPRIAIQIRMGRRPPDAERDALRQAGTPTITFTRGETNFTYTRPWTADYQREHIFCAERYSVIEASTKSGKTHGCIIWLVEQAFRGQRGWRYWWVAPVFNQAKIAYRRLRDGLTPGTFSYRDGDMTITLANGAVIEFKSGEKPDNLYGEDVYAAVIDEASRLREESWFAVRSTLTATRGPIRIIGNVKGRKNWAYLLARRAQAGAPNYHFGKMTAWDAVNAGILDREEVEDAQATLPEAIFRELYLAEASDDGGNPFGLQHIEACVGPLSPQPPIAWAWDLAKWTDWTVGIGLDDQGRVCRFERWNMTQLPDGAAGGYWEFTENRILEATNGLPALVESNGVGDPVFEGIARKARARGQDNFAPFVTTSTSKQQIMEGLAVGFQQRRITIPDYAAQTGICIRDEAEQFEYEVTRTAVRYRAPEGLHDDTVMALAMVWAIVDATPAPEGIVIYDQRVNISPF